MCDLSKKITMADIPEEQKQLAELVGLEIYLELVKVYGGGLLYIPMMEAIERNLRNEEIKEKFTGYNYRELAKEYNLTENSVRMIVADKDKEMKAKPCEGQCSLFENPI